MADAVVWGQLPKAQDDATTIDDAISAAIVAHEGDPTAHLGAGESLEVHRANEIIDHLAGSVLRDKLDFSRFIIDDYFVSIDAWTKTAGVTLPVVGQMQIISASTGTAYHFAVTAWGDGQEDWARQFNNPVDDVLLRLSTMSGILAYWGVSDYEDVLGYGWVVRGGSLYAWYYDDDENLHEYQLAGVDCTKFHSYRTSSDSLGNIIWFIDGVQIYSVVNLDSRGFDFVYGFYIKPVTSHNDYLWVLNWHHDQILPQ